MFSLNNFVKKGLLDAVGKMADYKVILNAAGWHEKSVLTESDLADIQSAIDEKNTKLAEAAEAAKNIPTFPEAL